MKHEKFEPPFEPHPTPKEQMEIEVYRANRAVGVALDELEANGGEFRFFACALMSAALEVLIASEGAEEVERMITKMALKKLEERGVVKKC